MRVLGKFNCFGVKRKYILVTLKYYFFFQR
jgi:hypothetical protein